MLKFKISYEQYDKISEDVEGLFDFHYIPTKEETEMIASEQMISHFLPFLIWILDYNEPETDSEKESVKLLNNLIIKNVLFVEEEVSVPKVRDLKYKEYSQIIKCVDALQLDKIKIPTEQQLEIIYKDMYYNMGLILIFLRKNRASSGANTYKQLKKTASTRFLLADRSSVFEISYKRYGMLCDKFRSIPLERGSWYPSKADVKKVILPNIKTALPFVIWLVECTPKPITEDEIKVYEMLKKAIVDNVRFRDEGVETWL